MPICRRRGTRLSFPIHLNIRRRRPCPSESPTPLHDACHDHLDDDFQRAFFPCGIRCRLSGVRARHEQLHPGLYSQSSRGEPVRQHVSIRTALIRSSGRSRLRSGDPNCMCGEGSQISSCVQSSCGAAQETAFSSLSASVCGMASELLFATFSFIHISLRNVEHGMAHVLARPQRPRRLPHRRSPSLRSPPSHRCPRSQSPRLPAAGLARRRPQCRVV